MDANKPDIALIRKYLNGELDARAMFELERLAEQDPFLWDVIRGMESSDINHEPNLTDIDQLIGERVAREGKRIIPIWRKWSVAASLLIALGIGGWWVLHESAAVTTVVANTPKVEHPDKVENVAVDTQGILSIAKKPLLAKLSKEKVYATGNGYTNYKNAASAAMVDKRFKTDTTVSKANTYAVQSNDTFAQLLKKLPDFEIDSAGNVKAEGKMLNKVRINGKDFNGGDLQTASKNLPADILAKVQTVDDYGDQAKKTSEAKVALGNELNLKSTQIKLKGLREVKTVTGKIVDKDNHLPLPGVAITLEGLKKASAFSDANGNFKIDVAGENAMLHVAYIGYAGQQLKVRAKDSLNIAMAPSATSLSEVVVTRKEPSDKEVEVEEPHPVIGWDAYDKYLKDNAKIADGKPGIVKVVFTVEADGTVTSIKVTKGLSGSTNNKAIQLIQKGPKWLPQSDGKPQEVKIRIRFH